MEWNGNSNVMSIVMSIASTHQRWGLIHKKGRCRIMQTGSSFYGGKVQKPGLQQSDELSWLSLKYCYGHATNMNTIQTVKMKWSDLIDVLHLVSFQWRINHCRDKAQEQIHPEVIELIGRSFMQWCNSVVSCEVESVFSHLSCKNREISNKSRLSRGQQS